MKPLRMSPQTLQVLQHFVAEPKAWRYGYDLSRDTSLKAGTLYPILMRLTEHSLLEAQWIASEAGTPPRHMYRLTAKGARFAKEKLADAPGIAKSLRPVSNRGRA